MLRAVIAFVLMAILVVESGAEEETPTDSNKPATTSEAKSSCSPYPEDLPSLVDCCKTPVLFDDELVGTCEFLCSEDKKNGQKPDCPILCLFHNNGLMKRKQINRTAVEATYSRFGLADPRWKSVTSEGLDRCPLKHEEGKNFQEAFNVFQNCMTSHYQKNCVEFKAPIECDKVEDFMFKCQDLHDDCSIWPKWIVKLPEFCCARPPQLFTARLRDEAESYCDSRGEVSNLGKMQCQSTYLVNITGIRTEAKWNYEIALKSLKESCNDDPKWSKAIEKTIEVCTKEVEDDVKEEKPDAYTNFWFYECVKGSLADFCPQYNDDKKCRRLTKFKEACPAAAPKRKALMVNGKM